MAALYAPQQTPLVMERFERPCGCLNEECEGYVDSHSSMRKESAVWNCGSTRFHLFTDVYKGKPFVRSSDGKKHELTRGELRKVRQFISQWTKPVASLFDVDGDAE